MMIITVIIWIVKGMCYLLDKHYYTAFIIIVLIMGFTYIAITT